ncbi:hypothetical protein ACFFMN_00270 [Planobispora siamensis]|uniref:Uncharacterized protein n=1 Tax=Planobispora siamensis TaxID=936338 RepID=A0A8J3WKY5_9ACTN|nr:hypothetical protein [Planobispora siamensis]GIH93243.1 hypothetical protein Psi01_38730 [Planobispora siamensis]
MAIVVTFTGKTALPGPDTGFRIWSYRIDPSPSGEIPANQQIALSLPATVDVQDPGLHPDLPQLTGTFLRRDPGSTRQYVGRTTGQAGAQTISFVAPAAESTCEMLLVRIQSNQPVVSLPFTTTPGGAHAPVQVLTAPVQGRPVFNGRPLTDFAGTLPYASETFGVYQPLAGWFGAQNTLRAATGTTGYEVPGLSREAFSGAAARTLEGRELAALAGRLEAAAQGVLSPVGLVNLFRQYFFEFDTFLGAPAGHLWISPGGTVEVVETSTRRTLVERVAEQAEETSRKVEESLTRQEDIADAVKEENANDTKLGVSATGGVNAPIYHADASASFSTQSTVKRSAEETHKHARTQSSKVTSEIKRNFKTTFKTVTDVTDTSSRRYVVQNTTAELVNYELRRKMRKVGVQLQHIGARLSWQVYLDAPGRGLGLGDMVDVVAAPDLTGVQKPEIQPRPQDQKVTYPLSLPFVLHQGADDEAENTYKLSDENRDHGIHKPDVGINNIIQFRFDFPLPPPPPGYEVNRIASIDFRGAQVQFTTSHTDLGMPANPDPARNSLGLRLTHANFQGRKSLPFDASIVYTPTAAAVQAIDAANAEARAAYARQVAQLQHEAYGHAVRERLKKVSTMRSRPPEDLRSEERQTVFGTLIRRLSLGADPHLGSELIRQLFDVDEMLYFVAPDFWRPSTGVTHPTPSSLGRYPVPPPPWAADQTAPLAGETVVSWYSHTDRNNALDPQGQATPEWRIDYLITEETQPAPLGSSLGWLIQIDGDERRNEFLNAAWAKAVLPVRPGHEVAALKWLVEVEGQAAFDLPYPFQPGDPPEYQGKKVGEVLQLLSAGLQASNTSVANLLATEEVFETGFDPLEGGFRPAEPYQIFDQWIEVLPTDQVVAVQVRYDPKTGQQL